MTTNEADETTPFRVSFQAAYKYKKNPRIDEHNNNDPRYDREDPPENFVLTLDSVEEKENSYALHLKKWEGGVDGKQIFELHQIPNNENQFLIKSTFETSESYCLFADSGGTLGVEQNKDLTPRGGFAFKFDKTTFWPDEPDDNEIVHITNLVAGHNQWDVCVSSSDSGNKLKMWPKVGSRVQYWIIKYDKDDTNAIRFYPAYDTIKMCLRINAIDVGGSTFKLFRNDKENDKGFFQLCYYDTNGQSRHQILHAMGTELGLGPSCNDKTCLFKLEKAIRGDRLFPGECLYPEGDGRKYELTAKCRKYKLIMQEDGNLVGYWGTWWCSYTHKKARTLEMGWNGMVTLKDNDGRVKKRFNTTAGVCMVLQSDRNICVYSQDGRCVWQSHTKR